MGRQQPSKSLAPPPVRKTQRAKAAKSTLSRTIPALLASDARARRGVENAELIVDPPAATTASTQTQDGSIRSAGTGEERTRNGPESRSSATAAIPHISIHITDTLGAAQTLHHVGGHRRPSSCGQQPRKQRRNVAILNMASPLRPGGGVRQGATSQEEHLCTRTTLLPGLREEWYRLPSAGGIWSPDVLVFRVGARELPRADRFHVDVVSAALLRFPEVRDGRYALQADREACVRQIRALGRILAEKRVERVVLGAWGCGAFGNPVAEVGRAFRSVLADGKDSALKEVVFAITDAAMAEAFAEAWGDGIEIGRTEAHDGDVEDRDKVDDEASLELEAKISELEMQIEQTRFPAMQERLGSVLDRLKAQRAAGEDKSSPEIDEDDREEGDGD